MYSILKDDIKIIDVTPPVTSHNDFKILKRGLKRNG